MAGGLGGDDGMTCYTSGTMTICVPRFRYFYVRTRMPGCKNYDVLGKTRSRRKAFRLLAEAMETGKYKRGDVLADEGDVSYYGPTQLVEMVQV